MASLQQITQIKAPKSLSFAIIWHHSFGAGETLAFHLSEIGIVRYHSAASGQGKRVCLILQILGQRRGCEIGPAKNLSNPINLKST
jgi:hypothetical protein